MAEAAPTPEVRACVVGNTDVGRVREHNEDHFLVYDRDTGKSLAPGQTFEGKLRTAMLLLVCDGMGGAAAGEVASKMAAQRVSTVLGKAEYGSATPDQVATLMDGAIQQANEEVFEKARATPEMKGMGTTLTAALVTPGRLFVSQVGDSRAYLLRKGLLNQITKDQSLIGQLIEEGTLTEEEAEKLGGRNIVLQAVGVEENLRVDTKSWPLLRGDVLLLCSDGLSGLVKDARMREILEQSGNDLNKAATNLIAEANANGGRDNITVVLARFDGDGLRPPMETEAGATLEAAGATFKAPPPPEVPNPMRKIGLWGAVLVAAIAAAFFLFRPTTAEISIASVKPPLARVSLLDAENREITSRPAGSGPVRLEKIPPGDYVLVISAQDHYDHRRPMAIPKPGSVELKETIWLEPMPGTIAVSSATRDVTAKLQLDPDHPDAVDFAATLRFPDSGDVRTIGNAAVGAYTLVAERSGFRTVSLNGRVEPKQDVRIDIPALQETKGRLAVEGAAGGRVEVQTDGGEPVRSGDAANDAWEEEVRAGRLVVRVTWPGFKPFQQVVELADGGREVVKARKEADKVPLIVEGTPDLVAVIEERDGESWVERRRLLIQTDGTTVPWNLLPGRYRVRSDDGRAQSDEFEVPPGGAAMRIALRSR